MTKDNKLHSAMVQSATSKLWAVLFISTVFLLYSVWGISNV